MSGTTDPRVRTAGVEPSGVARYQRLQLHPVAVAAGVTFLALATFVVVHGRLSSTGPDAGAVTLVLGLCTLVVAVLFSNRIAEMAVGREGLSFKAQTDGEKVRLEEDIARLDRDVQSRAI